MASFVVDESNHTALWGECADPKCNKPAHPASGTHGMCITHYVKWTNGYAKHYGWPIITEEELIKEHGDCD
mgnify:CR=1 FL=1